MSMIDITELGMEPEWRRAIGYFDDGDPSHVAEALKNDVPISRDVRTFLADVVTGERKPPTVGKARQLLTHDDHERLRNLAGLLNTYLSVKPAAIGLTRRAVRTAVNTMRKQVQADIGQRTGADDETLRKAWQAANRRNVTLKKQRRTIAQRKQVEQRRAAEAANHRMLASGSPYTNDPFGGKR